jgi:hypothetical protein
MRPPRLLFWVPETSSPDEVVQFDEQFPERFLTAGFSGTSSRLG